MTRIFPQNHTKTNTQHATPTLNMLRYFPLSRKKNPTPRASQSTIIDESWFHCCHCHATDWCASDGNLKKSKLVHFRYAISPPRPMMINENTRRSWQYPQLSVLSSSLKHIVFLFVSLVWHEIACTDKSGVTGCVFGRLMLLWIPHKHVALSFWFFFSLKS